jgi:hypothetical protein
MNMKRLTTLAAAFLILAPLATAQEYVGIPTEEMDYHAASQRGHQWCWAACISMVLDVNGVEVSQEEIVRRTYGTDPFGNLPDWPASWDVINRNLNGWGVGEDGERFTVRSGFGVGAPPVRRLIAELRAGRPVILAYSEGPGTGHAVVCTAVSFVRTPRGPVVQSIVVRDPAPDPWGVSHRGRKEYGGLALARLIDAYWTVRVTGEERSDEEEAEGEPPRVSVESVDWGNGFTGVVTVTLTVTNPSATTTTADVEAAVVSVSRVTGEALSVVSRRARRVALEPGETLRVKLFLVWVTPTWRPTPAEGPAVSTPAADDPYGVARLRVVDPS